MSHRHAPDLTECRECGVEFDLARQFYYDNICPSCLEEESPERTWPKCVECDQPVAPDNRDTKEVPGARRDPSTVYLTVHEECPPEDDET